MVLGSSGALAQAAPLNEAIVVGDWTFRPTVEVRIRGELRKNPADTGGAIYDTSATLGEGFNTTSPTVVDKRASVSTQYVVGERSRLGIGVDHAGTVTAQLTLQDARVFGNTDAALTGPGQPVLPSFAPFEAYIDVHTKAARKLFLRLGRQKVTWGDGRLVGEDDWSPTARSLDAARLGFAIGDFDFEWLAAMLAAPGALPPSVAGTRTPAAQATGAQLYGGDIVWHLMPLLNVEATGLARVVREPHPSSLTPSDTYVVDGHVFGDSRGFHYGVEGAYELGRVASYGTNRDVGAFALAATASLETSLPLHLAFAIEGAYASGDDGDPASKQKRFDPILPNEHGALGAMDLVAWSNVVEVGGNITAKPLDELDLTAGYRFVNLADAHGRWTTAALIPVGSAVTNGSTSLGNEIDAAARLTLWKPVTFEAGYGVFLYGDGAKAILTEALRSTEVQHWAFFQTIVRAP